MSEGNLQSQKAKLFISTEWQLILFFSILKLLVHLLTYSNFELHRDAYLYYAQSQHLAWGYIAVPPSIAVVGKIATYIFGNTVFALRFFPAVIGALNIIIIGLAVKELGGKKIAISLASLAFLLSPSYLHVNALFQPVCFNQFYWLLSCYLILLMIKRNEPKYWLWIAFVFGIGFLNKYSIVFFFAAFAISLLISKYRALYYSKYCLFALAIGFVIILPNLIWQYQHNWPVMMHMAELRETQLVHVQLSDFFLAQFLMNIQAILFWLGALLILFFYRKEAQYRVFAFTYIFIILFIAAGSGKAYYTLGIYPILFVFGAYFTEKYIKKYLGHVFVFMVIFMCVALYISLSFDGIPITTFEKAEKKEAFRWEDGVMHDIPQDMADMTGWKEIGETVADIYMSLGPENKNNCDIFCDHYGQAGSVMFYGKKENIPQPISFNGSFIFWSPDSLTKQYMIVVSEPVENIAEADSNLQQRFKKATLKKIINNPYFREKGTLIYLCEFPKKETKKSYKNFIGELKNNYRRK